VKASEILSRALENWGQDGSQWVRDQLHVSMTGSTCLVGGLAKAVTQHYSDRLQYPSRLIKNAHPDGFELRRAMTHIFDELEVRGIRFSVHSERRNDTIMLEQSLTAYNDHMVADFSQLREVVCGAVKRALAEEEAEEQKETDAQTITA
jgi:hypothetical protein